MKVCKECKIEKEIIDFYKNRNSCKECSKKLFNEYYKKNKEKKIAYQKKYYLENLEQIRDYKKSYYDNNSEKLKKERVKKYEKK